MTIESPTEPDPMPRSTAGELVAAPRREDQKQKRILIDGVKLLDDRIDGIYRCVSELLIAMNRIVKTEGLPWKIDVSLGYAGAWPLEKFSRESAVAEIANSAISSLLLHNQHNPIVRSRQRLGQLPKRRIWNYSKELAWYNLLGFARSVLKRYRKLEQSLCRVDQRYDLVHLTLPNTSQLYRHYRCPLLMTVHDLSHQICPDLQSSHNVESLAAGLNWAIEQDASFVSVSHATKQQMVERLGVAEKRIEVVHNSVKSETFQPVVDSEQLMALRKRYNIPNGKFLLCLGTIEPRKNLRNIIKAFGLLQKNHPDPDLHLVVAGGRGWENHDELQQSIRECPQIQFIGYVEDHDLPALYSAATALCYVSLYEGFGLPLLESMACGTPVIYGDNSSMPEIAEGAGLPADATCPENIKQAMQRIVSDASLREELASQAVLKARSMTWDQAARRTLRCYGQAMGLPAPEASVLPFDARGPDSKATAWQPIAPENEEPDCAVA